MNTHDTLLAFSEWMDTEKICHDPRHDPLAVDTNVTHEQIVVQFIEHWESNPQRAPLAGREPVKGQAAADLSADALGLQPVSGPRCPACGVGPNEVHDATVLGTHLVFSTFR